MHGADQQAGEAPTGSMRHRTRRPQVGHSDSFTLAAAVVVLHIRCAASVVWTACGFWAQKQASTHAVSTNACAIDITGICGQPGAEKVFSSFSRAVELLCVHWADLHICTRLRALLRARNHAATLLYPAPMHVCLTLRVCLCMLGRRSARSLALRVTCASHPQGKRVVMPVTLRARERAPR